MKQHNLNST